MQKLKPLTDAQQAEVVRWMPTAERFANRFACRWQWLKDDIFASANLALVKAVIADQGGGSFDSYLYTAVKREIILTIRRHCSGRGKYQPKWGDPEAIRYLVAVSDEHVSAVESADSFDATLSKLNPLDQQILKMQFVDGMLQKEIGNVIGMNRVNVNIRSKKALRKLAAQFA